MNKSIHKLFKTDTQMVGYREYLHFRSENMATYVSFSSFLQALEKDENDNVVIPSFFENQITCSPLKGPVNYPVRFRIK